MNQAADHRQDQARAPGATSTQGSQTFQPEQPRGGRTIVLASAALPATTLLAYAGKGLPLAWSFGSGALVSSLCLSNFAWLRFVRGLDEVTVHGDRIEVANRRKRWSLRWGEIGRVYRFKEQLIFETPRPECRRSTLLLDGHEAHARELVEAIVQRARAQNLGWLDTLSDLSDLL